MASPRGPSRGRGKCYEPVAAILRHRRPLRSPQQRRRRSHAALRPVPSTATGRSASPRPPVSPLPSRRTRGAVRHRRGQRWLARRRPLPLLSCRHRTLWTCGRRSLEPAPPRCSALFILQERPASLGLPAVGARPSPHGAPICLLLFGTSLVLRVQIQQGSNPTRSQVLQVEV